MKNRIRNICGWEITIRISKLLPNADPDYMRAIHVKTVNAIFSIIRARPASYTRSDLNIPE
jgi:hypothetical protein